MQIQAGTGTTTRSTFVTVLAWIFIVFAGFSTFISLLQNVMINTMFPLEQMRSQGWSANQQMPAFFQFMLGHIQLFFLLFLLLSSSTLAAAIGLLRRKNWARLVFVAILALGIVWNVAGLVLQQVMFSSMSTPPSNAPAGFRAEFDHMTSIMFAFTVVMAVGFSVLFAWLIKRLVSAPIRGEFTQAL